MDKNILILVDMEGCAGVTDMKQYDVCKKKMIEEAERVIQLMTEKILWSILQIKAMRAMNMSGRYKTWKSMTAPC